MLFDVAAYMDDIAIPIIDTAANILHKAARAFEIADELFSKYSFKLNYKMGKSNAIVRIAGKGAKQIYQDLAVDNFQTPCNMRGK